MATATTTPSSNMSSALASAAGTSGLQLNGKPRVPPLKTRGPLSATYPSELRSPLHSATTPRSSRGLWSAGGDLRTSGLSPAFSGATIFSAGGARTPTSTSIKREWEDDSVDHGPNAITPPPAYLDFLRVLTPILTSPATGTSQHSFSREFGSTSATFTSGGDGKSFALGPAESPGNICSPNSVVSSDSISTAASLSAGSSASLNSGISETAVQDADIDPALIKMEPSSPKDLGGPDELDITPTAPKRDEPNDQDPYQRPSPLSRTPSTSSIHSIPRPPPAVVSNSQLGNVGSPPPQYQIHRPANIQIPPASEFMRSSQSYIHTPALASSRPPPTPGSAKSAPKSSAHRRMGPSIHIPNSGKSVVNAYPSVSGVSHSIRSPLSAGVRSPRSAGGVRSPLSTAPIPGAVHSPAVHSPAISQSPLTLSGALTGPLAGPNVAPSPTCVSVREVVTRTVVWARGPGQSSATNGTLTAGTQEGGRESERREGSEKRRKVEH